MNKLDSLLIIAVVAAGEQQRSASRGFLIAVRCCNCKLPIHDEECGWACGEVARVLASSPQWQALEVEYNRRIPGAAMLTLGSYGCKRCHLRTWEEYDPASGRAAPADDMPRWVRLAGQFTGVTLRIWLG